MFKEKKKERRQNENLKKTDWRTSFLDSSLSWVLCVIVYVFFRQGGALINEQSGAIVQALNYFGPVVFQKQGSNREENTESNAS